MTCEALHPSGARCNRSGTGEQANHVEHTTLIGNELTDWPNENYKAPAIRSKGGSAHTRDRLKKMAARIKADPGQRYYLPDSKTRLGRVALFMVERLGEPIFLFEIETEDIGGAGVEKRVVQLRDGFGWPIRGDAEVGYTLTEDPRKTLWQQ